MKSVKVAAFVLAIPLGHVAYAQDASVSDDIVRIGVLTDMSGFLSDVTGPGAAHAVRMAVEDFGGTVLGKKVDVVSADNLNKADVASNIARTWFDTEAVDMIIDLGNSATGLSTVEVANQKNKIAIATSPGTTRITNENCGPTIIHYAYDTYALANGIAKALVADGLDSWYFITIDFAGGHAIEKDASDTVEAGGGKVIGAARHPMDASDFSSFALQAQASGAKVVGFATAGGAAINAIKTANEFGLRESGQTLAGLYLFISDVHSLGLDAAQGMYVTTGFYWDHNEETRAWSQRYFEHMGRMPTMIHAADYSATMHYLRAIEAAGTDAPQAVMAKMREMPINDFFATNGRIREDGRMVHEMYLAQVKSPSESQHDWDYYQIQGVIPGNDAFQPIELSTCEMMKKN